MPKGPYSRQACSSHHQLIFGFASVQVRLNSKNESMHIAHQFKCVIMSEVSNTRHEGSKWRKRSAEHVIAQCIIALSPIFFLAY